MIPKSKFVLVPFAVSTMVLTAMATVYACTNFNGEWDVVGNASTQHVYSTGNDGIPPNPTFGMTQTINGACCAKATHTLPVTTPQGTVTVSAAADRNNSANKLPSGSYDVNFLGGAAYGTHGSSWSLDCMDGSAGISQLAHNVTVSSTGAFGPATYNIPSGQVVNQTNPQNESAVCISDSAANYGNEVPVTLV